MSEPASPHLSVQVHQRVGSLILDVDFHLTQPWTILFGPSGSGKTTILRAICGLSVPDRAKIVLLRHGQPQIVTDTAINLAFPPHARNMPLVAQRSPLFPHRTVRENVAYGAGRTSAAGRVSATVDSTIQQLGLTQLVSRMPASLSGGERQRVAIARAVAAACSMTPPGLLLLDEPFTGLDLPLRDELIAALTGLCRAQGIDVLSVTHDISEAFQLEAEVIKLADGRITAQGPAAEVLAAERARLLAQLNVTTAP